VLHRIGIEVGLGIVPGGFEQRLALTFTASTMRVDRVPQ
jgi:hypothetical protein